MPTVLREDQQARVDELVRQGAYADPAAVLDDALLLAEHKAKFRALVQEGIDDLNQGRVVDCKTAFDEARRAIAEAVSERTVGTSAS